ncbi:DUF883 family protein [Pseudaestuariivita rosea]|uniref:DUF883 family protein n=1 Tax=Pseudaestuariivita rosea TaxID=2763263 RepID=UPI001ABA2721|nr:DUF883 family protein [Pseudaestuariivita rosea]
MSNTAPEHIVTSEAISDDDNMSDKVKKRLSEVGDQLRETASSHAGAAKDIANANLKSTSDAVEKVSREGSRFVKENPGLAIAGAVGVGVIIGLMIRNRY